MEPRHAATHGIPSDAHQLILFFSTSLHIHDTIYTKHPKRNVEQWLELVVRFYIHDKNKSDKRGTYAMLKRLQPRVHDMIAHAFQFEGLLHRSKKESLPAHEAKLKQHWHALYQNMSSEVSHRNRNGNKRASGRRVTYTHKKTCV
jgi:hypothetical protein